jgi:hypothetical protein
MSQLQRTTHSSSSEPPIPPAWLNNPTEGRTVDGASSMPAQMGMLTGTNADMRKSGLIGSPSCECTADSYAWRVSHSSASLFSPAASAPLRTSASVLAASSICCGVSSSHLDDRVAQGQHSPSSSTYTALQRDSLGGHELRELLPPAGVRRLVIARLVCSERSPSGLVRTRPAHRPKSPASVPSVNGGTWSSAEAMASSLQPLLVAGTAAQRGMSSVAWRGVACVASAAPPSPHGPAIAMTVKHSEILLQLENGPMAGEDARSSLSESLDSVANVFQKSDM